LIGFFYLPGRINNGWPYDSVGLGGWHFKKKLGESQRHAPIMSDRLQAVGSWIPGSNNGFVTWATTFNGVAVKTASHRAKGGVPEGGNFLFEDGRGVWYKFNVKNVLATVDVGSLSEGWTLFYRPFNISTNL